MPSRPRIRFFEHPGAYMLRLFGDVRPGEAATALLLALNVFLIFLAYYLLKVAREPLILLGGGAEVKSYASFGQSILLIGVASLYAWLATRMNRIVLITAVTIFFLVNLVVFWVLGMRGVHIGVPFFLWVGIFNIVTITQFWSFAADTYTEEQGKRLFPIVGIGSSIGSVGGAWLAAPLIRHGSPFLLMIVSAVIFLAALGLTIIVHKREIPKGDKHEVHDPVLPGNAFVMIVKDRYLLLFALLVLVLNYVTKSGDYVLDRMLILQAPEHAAALGISKAQYIGEFKAHYFEWINVIGVVLQLFMVSRIVKYLGLRTALVLVPIASFAGYGAAVFVPVISVMMVNRVVESSLDYSLSNTTQQTLWLTTSREAKYKAKQVIDSFCRRGGDALSAGVVWVGAHWALGTRAFLAINVALTLVWVFLAFTIGTEFMNKAKEAEKKKPGASGPSVQGAAPAH